MLVPIPELAAARRLLCIQPHYDDNDIGAGGTLTALAHAGSEVVYLTVTDDLLGVRDDVPDAEARARLRAEQERASQEIGVSRQIWLDLPDGGEYDYFALRRALVREIRRVRPDFLVTCDPWMPYEAHSDHRAVGRASAEAALFQKFPRYRTGADVDVSYEPYDIAGVAFYFTAAPNVVFDIEAVRSRKHRALDAYVSQFAPPELALLHAALELKERTWAGPFEFSHGEALKVLSPTHLHVNPDAEEILRSTNAVATAARPLPASPAS